jgi:hypothetical protein
MPRAAIIYQYFGKGKCTALYWLSHLFCMALAGSSLVQSEKGKKELDFFESAQNHTKQMTQPVFELSCLEKSMVDDRYEKYFFFKIH